MIENVIAAGLLLPELTRSVAEEHLDELEQLIATAGGNVVGKVLARRPAPDSATWKALSRSTKSKSSSGHKRVRSRAAAESADGDAKEKAAPALTDAQKADPFAD